MSIRKVPIKTLLNCTKDFERFAHQDGQHRFALNRIKFTADGKVYVTDGRRAIIASDPTLMKSILPDTGADVYIPCSVCRWLDGLEDLHKRFEADTVSIDTIDANPRGETRTECLRFSVLNRDLQFVSVFTDYSSTWKFPDLDSLLKANKVGQFTVETESFSAKYKQQPYTAAQAKADVHFNFCMRSDKIEMSGPFPGGGSDACEDITGAEKNPVWKEIGSGNNSADGIVKLNAKFFHDWIIYCRAKKIKSFTVEYSGRHDGPLIMKNSHYAQDIYVIMPIYVKEPASAGPDK